jgi:hypothetical protein
VTKPPDWMTKKREFAKPKAEVNYEKSEDESGSEDNYRANGEPIKDLSKFKND